MRGLKAIDVGDSDWRRGLSEGACLGLAVAFQLWIVSGPQPADPTVSSTMQQHLPAGLPVLALRAGVGGMAVGLLLGASPVTRVWRARLALACCGLYVAATLAAIGPPAVVIAPACAVIWLIALSVQRAEPRGGAVLVTLHAGAFFTALAFFHQWAWYRAGWVPFIENLGALAKLWLGR